MPWLKMDLAGSPDGKLLASAFERPALALWTTPEGKAVRVLRDKGFGRCVSFSPDGKYVAVGLHDGLIELYDVQSGKLRRQLPGHEGEVRQVLFDKAGKHLVSWALDHTIKIWAVDFLE